MLPAQWVLELGPPDLRGELVPTFFGFERIEYGYQRFSFLSILMGEFSVDLRADLSGIALKPPLGLTFLWVLE